MFRLEMRIETESLDYLLQQVEKAREKILALKGTRAEEENGGSGGDFLLLRVFGDAIKASSEEVRRFIGKTVGGFYDGRRYRIVDFLENVHEHLLLEHCFFHTHPVMPDEAEEEVRHLLKHGFSFEEIEETVVGIVLDGLYK